ncbi:MAG: helix-turn-helix transcriptional regulator [Pseudonocardiales bacterium]|nr:helix-turn-helix transcriptional regulator [Pseudonocardiales bacterium]
MAGSAGQRRCCAGCGIPLARDNRSPRCGPCSRREVARELQEAASAPTKPEDFWRGAALQEALAARHFGQVLYAYRHEHRPVLTQATVGRWLGLTQGQISRLERTPQPTHDLTKLDQWARALHIPQRYLWFQLSPQPDADTHLPEPADSLNHESQPAEKDGSRRHLPLAAASVGASRDTDRHMALTPPETLASMVAVVGAELTEGFAAPLAFLTFLGAAADQTLPADWADQIQDQLTRFLRRWANTMKRRKLLQQLGSAATTVAAAPIVIGLNAEEQERLTRAIVSPNLLDETVINHLATMLQGCKRLDDALGSRAVLPTALAQRNLVRSLLGDCPSDLRPQLLSVYSDMSTSIAYYFFDHNDYDSAQRYGEQARAAARDAGDIELTIYALCEMSDHASWQGKAHPAIELAAAAQSLVSKTEDPAMRTLAAQAAGTAYALDGQYTACLVEFERAQDALASAEQAPAGSIGYYLLNQWYLPRAKSQCLLWLGRPQEAAESAKTALALYDKSFVDGHAVCMLYLGNAHLQSGEIDEAARVIGDAAGLAAQTHSARLVKELRTTRARMQPWQTTPAIKQLDDQWAAYGLESS